jgi:hypothetical protein
VVVGIASFVVHWDTPIAIKYLVLVSLSFAGTLALYEGCVRRFRFMRVLFGMKPGQGEAGPASRLLSRPWHVTTT